MNISFEDNPRKKAIFLSVVLSTGFFLLLLLSMYENWFPIIDGFIFATAYLPLAISHTAFNLSDYDFNFDPQTSSKTLIIQEVGKFFTAFLTATGFCLPLLLHHSLLLSAGGLLLTIFCGVWIFSSVYMLTKAFFASDNDTEEIQSGMI